MATQGYDPQKAQAYNQWLQNNPGQPVGETLAQQFARIRAEKAAAGIPQGSEGSAQYAALKATQRQERESQAMAAAGITDAEAGNYAIGTNGQMGALVIGNDRFETPSPDFENDTIKQVPYPQKASAPVSSKTPINYTTTSTETVSGGGSTTIYAGTRSQTPKSEAFAAAALAKDEEIAQLNRDNPSNFIRKRQGLPLLSPEEEAARAAKVNELKDQRTQLRQSQQDSESTTPGSTVTVPNTTTTTQTTTTGTTAVNTPVETLDGNDPALNQQTEIQLGTTLSNPTLGSTAAPLPVAGGTTNVDNVENISPVPLDPNQDEFGNLAAAQAAAAERAPDTQSPEDVQVGFDDGLPPAPEFNDQPIDFEAPPVDPETEALLEQQQAINRAQLQQEESIAYAPAPVPPSQAGPIGAAYDDDGNLMPGYTLDENGDPVFVGGDFVEPATQASAEASRTAAQKINAQNQSTLQSRINQPSAADWRVRLQLAPGANYLYKESDKNNRGILAPLWDTDGVVFPYTPSIETAYKAKYDAYDLVHSNYRGYFYKNSNVEEISIKGTFTAQDTREAQYLLAVIHFFRSVTKMFYGQDAQAGTPPPLVFLSGLGQYQFNQHPCVVSSFNYSLPTDVDYIRADGFNNIGVNLENRRSLGSGPSLGGALGTVQRLLTNGLFSGAQPTPPWSGAVTQNVSNQNSINSTYVPTKMEISISLLPMQTRNQISQQFSLKGFGQGRLLSGGFW